MDRCRQGDRAPEKMSECKRLLPSLHLVPLIWRPLIPPNTRQTPHASALAQSPALTLQVCACARMCWIHTLLSLGVLIQLPLPVCFHRSVCVCVHTRRLCVVLVWFLAAVCSPALHWASSNPAETATLLPRGRAAGPWPSALPSSPPPPKNICSVCFSFLSWHSPSPSSSFSPLFFPALFIHFSAVFSKGNCICLVACPQGFGSWITGFAPLLCP